MSSIGAAPCAAASLSPARAEASRRNGAKSRGPKTPEGKARSAQNALKHGLRAQKHMVLRGESATEFAALEAALMEELAPEGALQAALAQRVVSAVWRLSRAERLEAELFAHNHLAGRGLGLALIRDCNGARSFDTLLRYRGGTLAELWRALRTLKALQAEQAAMPRPAVPTPQPMVEAAQDREAVEAQAHAQPIKPEGRRNPGISEPSPVANEPALHAQGAVHAPAREPCPLLDLGPAHLQHRPQPSAPGQGEAATGWGAMRSVPEAIAPHRERRHPAAPPAQPSRSTP